VSDMNRVEAVALGQTFVQAVATQDFRRIEALFAPQVHFRGLLPSSMREENTAGAAAGWLRRWFGEADRLEALQSTADQVFDRLYVSYRLRTHEPAKGWRLIEQQAYCVVQDGHIADMWLLCSGFRPDPEMSTQTKLSGSNVDAFYDAGDKGCTDGPLDDVAGLLRRMSPGQVLDVHAIAPSVAADLPAWCRLTGHALIGHEGEHYFIRK
jgi:TusA-related sulfurtransferase